MIARTWRGVTSNEHANEYVDYLEETGVREYEATEGNRGVYVLRRALDDRTEFLLVSLWDSMEAVEAFAGPRPEQAVFYPEDQKYLIEADRSVEHYEVVGMRRGAP